MANGALTEKVGWGFHGVLSGSRVFLWVPRHSFCFLDILGAEVDDTLYDSWKHSFAMGLYLAAKPSHVGVDANRLAWIQHHPMARSCKMGGQSLATRHCLVLSCCCNGRWKFLGGCEVPCGWIFVGELAVWVPALPNLTLAKLSLPGDIPPTAEPSWCSGVYSWPSCYIKRRWDGYNS
jgi:hypothetical protein